MSKQKHSGVCHICGQYGDLTYEHIPPKTAFNSIKRKLCSVETLLEDPSRGNLPPWDTSGLKYESFQQGVGFYTLCQKCNNFTGSKYGEDYKRFIQGIGHEIMKISKEKRQGVWNIHVHDINMLAVFKQIVSMFCSINTPEFGENFREFLLNEDSIDFDCNRFKVCTYLHSGNVDRYIPVQISCNVQNGTMAHFSEISTFPLGFIFFYVDESKFNMFCGCDMTVFATRKDIHEVDIPIPFLSCNTPFGLDFRDI